MSTAIFWFRQDLRATDNPALNAACQHPEVIPLYISETPALIPMGGAQKWWLHHSLHSLHQCLQKSGLQLILQSGDPLDILTQFIQQHKVSTVYWNRCYEPQHIARDKLIKARLQTMGITVKSFNASLLNEPWTVQNQSNTWFKVFTPYWRQALKQIAIPEFLPPPTGSHTPSCQTETLSSWKLLPTKPNWAAGFSDYWQPGEEGASKKLEVFLKEHLGGYQQQRDIPSADATSRLSPHLHFGEISPWQIWRAVEALRYQANTDNLSADRFLSEIGWREFSYYLLYHFPELPQQNVQAKFSQFPWHDDEEALLRWQKGLTGYPIVDAGMRELWHTGYMHNRVRMIVASFLTKDLFIDWRKGADWFWDTLVDADMANNSASWQWVAGCGADAAPYFRIFNPVLQSEKFDPQGSYIKQWVPELMKLDAKSIHQPWTSSFVKNYPQPLVDHAKARELALAYYKELK